MKISFDKVYLWSDSTITLCWIRGCPSRWKSFVSNRVVEIHRQTNSTDWHHISTTDNPADLISRGIRATEIIKSDVWWKGPHWLSTQTLKFTKFNAPNQIPEQRVFVNLVAIGDSDWFSNYSSLTKLQRVSAYCLRYIRNLNQVLKNRASGNPLRINLATGILTVAELSASFKKINCVVTTRIFSIGI